MTRGTCNTCNSTCVRACFRHGVVVFVWDDLSGKNIAVHLVQRSKMVSLVKDRVQGSLLVLALAATVIRPIRELQHHIADILYVPLFLSFIWVPFIFLPFITQSRPLTVTSLNLSVCPQTPSRSPGQPGGRHCVSFVFSTEGV